MLICTVIHGGLEMIPTLIWHVTYDQWTPWCWHGDGWERDMLRPSTFVNAVLFAILITSWATHHWPMKCCYQSRGCCIKRYASETGLNSLAPRKFEWNFRYVILKRILVIDGWGISWNCPDVNVISEVQWTSLMISQHGSGNGMVPSGNKLLPEPMLTQFHVAIWRHQATNAIKSHLSLISISVAHSYQCAKLNFWSTFPKTDVFYSGKN